MNGVVVTEEWLKLVWADLLQAKAEEITENSNFFALGGDSKLGSLLVSRFRQVLNRPEILNLYTIFQFPNFGDFARNTSEVIYLPKNDAISNIQTELSSGPYALSFAQEQLWLQLEENPSSNWNVVRLLQFEEEINVDGLDSALNRILVENESLRITFFTCANKVWQHTNPVKQIRSSLTTDLNITSMLATLRSTSLGTSLGPLITFHRHKDATNQLIICYHHILMDGHGWTVFLEKLDKYYNSFRPEIMDSQTICISPLEAIRWEQYNLNNTNFHKSLQFWKTYLKGFSPVKLSDGFDKCSTHVQTNILYNVDFSKDLSARLIELARAESVTVFSLMFSIFKILTYRYTKEKDQTIVTLFRSGDVLEGTQLLMGHFVNLLPIRSQIDPAQSFSTFLMQIQNQMSNGLKNSGVPYQNIINSLTQVDRTVKLQLLKVMFQMRPRLLSPLSSFQEIHLLEQGAAVVDLGIDIELSGRSQIQVSIEYNPQVFSAQYVQRLMGHYVELSTSIVREPVVPVNKLNMIAGAERTKILDKFSIGDKVKWPEGSLIDLFKLNVKANPRNRCIQDSTDYTYAQADEISDHIANHVSNTAVGDHSVAILLPRGSQFLLSVLGILKVNKTVAPISLTHPETYIRHMLEDLGNPPILTNRNNFSKISALYDRILIVEEAMLNCNQYTPPQCDESSSVSSPAYTFFTSGTTGFPKGVMVHEASILNVGWTYVHQLSLKNTDRSLFFHNPGFDASIADYWPSLISGGCICVADEHLSYDPLKLWDFLIENQITYANFPTSVAKHLFSNFQYLQTTDSLHHALKWIALGGEALKVAPPSNFPAKCLNAYGPTECCVDATHIIVSADSVTKNVIGRPIPNVSTYILDDKMDLVPIGVEGVLWIGGRGLSAGYLNRPHLTQKVFRKNPFIDAENIYCSGDVAKWNDDGSIVILGRVDDQIKMNGYRIELEEIGAAIQAQVGVTEAAAIYIPKSQQIIGFCVAKIQGLCIPDAQLIRFLGTKLPRYAIPKHFFWIKSMPLTANQKVNRKRLKELYDEHQSLQHNTDVLENFGNSFSKTETLLAQIWVSVFQLDFLTLEKSTTFYEVGGSSVLIGLLLRKINNALETQGSKPLPLQFKDIFENPSLASMAKMMEVKRDELERYDNFLTSYQRYIWFHQEFELGTEHPMYRRHRVFELSATADLQKILDQVRSILEKFKNALCLQLQVLRGNLIMKQYHWSDFEKHQFISKRCDDLDLKNYLVEEMCQPFDLIGGRNPLFRSQIVQSRTTTYLCFFWHHIIVPYETYVSLYTEIEKVDGLCSPSDKSSVEIHGNINSVPATLRYNFNVEVLSLPIGCSSDVFTTLADLLYNLELDFLETIVLVIDGPDTALIPAEELLAITTRMETKFPLVQKSFMETDIFGKISNSGHRIIVRILEDCLEPTVMTTGITSPLVLSATQAYLSADFDFYVKVFPHKFLEIEYNSDKFEAYTNKLRPRCTFISNRVTKATASSIATSPWYNLVSKLLCFTLEIPLTEIWARKDVSLLNLGGTTDQLLQLYSTLASMLDSAYLPLKEFYSNSSLKALVQLLTKLQPFPSTGPESPIPFLFESEVTTLTRDLVPLPNFKPYKNLTQGRVVLLTGSTGYLGAFILQELIGDPSVKAIYCHGRGYSERVLENLKRYSNLEQLPAKVTVFVGDLAQKNLGFERHQYDQIADEVDLILHCGASVNLIQTYAELRATNVLGTKQLCQLAMTGKGKTFHYISTTETALSQFLFSKKDEMLPESISCPPYFDMGYCQSKWVAEGLVQHTNQFVPARIYRVGTVGGHSTASYPIPESFDGSFLRACLKLKTFPQMNGYTVPYSDVDFIAEAVVLMAKTEPDDQKIRCSYPQLIVNVIQRNYSLSELIEIGTDQIGFSFKMESPKQWYENLKSFVKQTDDDADLEKLLLILEQKPWGRLSRLDLFEFSVQTPFITYPNSVCESLCRLAKNEYSLSAPNILKYLQIVNSGLEIIVGCRQKH